MCLRYRQSPPLTLGGVSTGPVLHQDVVKGLMVAVRQAVDVHVSDPFVSHHTGGVPAVDDTVIAVPDQHKSSHMSASCLRRAEHRGDGLASPRLTFLQIYLPSLYAESISLLTSL